MFFDAGASVNAQAAARVSAKVVAASTILAMTAADLEQEVVKEVQENPALEMTALPPADHGAEVAMPNDDPGAGHALRGFDQLPGIVGARMHTGDIGDDEYDPVALVAAPMTLPEQLLEQLRLQIAASEEPIATYLAWNLDEHGYLPEDIVVDAAATLGVNPEAVEGVLAQLQDLDPPGVGARNLRECLLLQTRQLQEEGVSHPLVEALIQGHLEDVGRRRWGPIARALGVSAADVQAAAAFIKKNLNPYPAQQYYAARGAVRRERPAAPSVLIHEDREREDYRVEVVESRRFVLQVNPLYQLLLHPRAAQSGASSSERRLAYELDDDMRAALAHIELGSEERAHVVTYVERARAFISALQQRYRILQDIAEALVSAQRDFLRRGPLYLRYLTQAMVAEAVQVHPSTVSRATSGKFALLPSHVLTPLSVFFAAELKVREVMRELIEQEETPLSDQRLAEVLTERGMPLSRQMVAVHREQMGIPSARERARLRRSG
jgi:RNA polymerase sigma-54 factor